MLIFWEYLHAQQTSDGPGLILPGTGIHSGLAVVKERDFFLLQVKAVHILDRAKRILVPEPTGDGRPRAHSHFLDEVSISVFGRTKEDVLVELAINAVA